jgi:hypothetical protein
MALSMPEAASPHEIKQSLIYSTSVAQEQYLYIPSSVLRRQASAELVLTLSHSSSETPFYALTVLTPSAGLMMVQKQASALADVHSACCSSATYSSDTLCARGWAPPPTHPLLLRPVLLLSTWPGQRPGTLGGPTRPTAQPKEPRL